MPNSLDDLFSYTSPEKLRQSITEVFFSWLTEQPELPYNYKEVAEDFYFLLKLLDEEEQKRKKNS